MCPRVWPCSLVKKHPLDQFGRMKKINRTGLGFVTTLLLVIAVALSGQATSVSLPLVALGHEDNPQACVGIVLSAQHVLVHSACAADKGTLTMARVLKAPLSDSMKTTTTQGALGSTVAIAKSTVIPFQQLPSNASASANVQSVNVLTLEGALPLDTLGSAALPLKTPYPGYLAVDKNALLVAIDLSTLHVASVKEVVFVDNSSCDHPVCALSLDVKDRVAHSSLVQWSFLLTQSGDDTTYRLLGVGGGPVTDHNDIWGFQWLPHALTASSFASHDIHGVKTIVSVSKEIYDGKNVKYSSEYTEFIAGLRAYRDSSMACGAALIAPKWVLTAAGCVTGDLRFVAIDTLPTFGEPTEVMQIKRKIAYPRRSGHKYNFMLVQLDRPSSRRPIKYNQNKDNTPVSSMATAFGYGSTSYDSKKLHHRLRSMKVEVLGADYCPKSLKDRVNESNMCVKKQLCYGDFGGPVITDAWSDKRVLYGIISNDFYCSGRNYYNVVGRVSQVADWIKLILSAVQ